MGFLEIDDEPEPELQSYDDFVDKIDSIGTKIENSGIDDAILRSIEVLRPMPLSRLLADFWNTNHEDKWMDRAMITASLLQMYYPKVSLTRVVEYMTNPLTRKCISDAFSMISVFLKPFLNVTPPPINFEPQLQVDAKYCLCDGCTVADEEGTVTIPCAVKRYVKKRYQQELIPDNSKYEEIEMKVLSSLDEFNVADVKLSESTLRETTFSHHELAQMMVATPDASTCVEPHDETMPSQECETCKPFIFTETIQGLTNWIMRPVRRNYNKCTEKHTFKNPSYSCNKCFPVENTEVLTDDETPLSLMTKISRVTGLHSKGSLITENSTYISAGVGVLILLSLVTFGRVSKKPNVGTCMGIIGGIGTLGMFMRNKSFLDKGLKDAYHGTMGIIYQLFGLSYQTQQEKARSSVVKKIIDMRYKCEEYLIKSETDFFQFMREGLVERIRNFMDEIVIIFGQISHEEKSLYNVKDHITRINEIFVACLEHVRAVQSTAAGKQEPVRVWIYGAAGLGKTHFAQQYIKEMNKEYNCSHYDRKCMDKYWSRYAGQPILLYDDMGQQQDHLDIGEWVLHAHGGASTTIGAAINEKGKAINPMIMVATSIYHSLAEGVKGSKTITDAESLYRRRDVVIHAHNPAAAQFVKDNGHYPSPTWMAENPTKFYLQRPVPPLGENAADLNIINFQGNKLEVTVESLKKWTIQRELYNRRRFYDALSEIPSFPRANLRTQPPTFDRDFAEDPYNSATNYSKLLRIPIQDCRNLPGGNRDNPQTIIPDALILPKMFPTSECIVNLAYAMRVSTRVCDHHPIPSNVEIANMIVRLRFDPPYDEVFKKWSHQFLESMNTSTEAITPFAGGTFTRTTTQSILLEGPPGTGKTCVSELFPKTRRFEDFTLTTQKFEEACQAADEAYQNGEVCIFTANPGVLRDDQKERYDIIKRRCDVFSFYYGRRYGVGPYYTQRDTQKKLTQEMMDKIIKIKVTRLGQEFEIVHSQAKGMVQEMLGNPTTKSTTTVLGGITEFMRPKHVDFIVNAIDHPLAEIIDTMKTNPLGLRKYLTIHDEARIFSILNTCMTLYKAAPKGGTLPQEPGTYVEFINSVDALCAADCTLELKTIEGDIIILCEKGLPPAAWKVVEEKIDVFEDHVEHEGIVYTPKEDQVRLLNAYKRVTSLKKHIIPRETALDHAKAQLEFQRARLSPATRIMLASFDLALNIGVIAQNFKLSHKKYNPVKETPKVHPCALNVSQIVPSDHQPQTVSSVASPIMSTPQIQGKRETSDTTTRPTESNLIWSTPQQQGRRETSDTTTRPTETSLAWSSPQHQGGRDTSDTTTRPTETKFTISNAWRQTQDFISKIIPKEQSQFQSVLSEMDLTASDEYIAEHQLQSSQVSPTRFSEITKQFTNVDGSCYALLSFEDAREFAKALQLCEIHKSRGFQIFSAYATDTEHVKLHEFRGPSKVLSTYLGNLAIRQNRCYLLILAPSARPFVICDHLVRSEQEPGKVVDVEPEPQNCQDEECMGLIKKVDTDHIYAVMPDEGVLPQHYQRANSWAVAVKGKYFITVAHNPYKNIILGQLKNGNWKWVKAIRVSQSAYVDVALFKVTDPKFNDKEDIIHRFFKQSDLLTEVRSGVNTMVSLTRTEVNAPEHYRSYINMRMDLKIRDMTEPTSRQHIEHSVFTNGAAGSDNITQKGDCGLPYYRYLGEAQRKIYGIHHAGTPSKALCAVVTQETIAELIAAEVSHQENPIQRVIRDLDGWEEVEPTIHPSGLTKIGTSKHRIFPPQKTRLYRTGLEFPEEPDLQPAILSTRDPRNPNMNYLEKGLRLYDVKHGDLDRSEIRRAYQLISGEIISRCKSADLDVRVLSLTQAVNGASKVEFPCSNSIDRDSAVGFPYAQVDKAATKHDYLEFNPITQIWQIKQDAKGKSLINSVNSLLSDAGKGDPRGVVFTCYGKDELVKGKKIIGDSAKTRVFMSAPFPYVLAWRRYFLTAVNRMQQIFHQIPIKIGINGRGMDWDGLYHSLAKVGVYGFDTDCKDWDANINPIWQEEMPEHFWNPIFRALDRNHRPQDDVTRTSLHMPLNKPVVIAESDIIELAGGQVSGQPGTAPENSVINWALCFIIWRRLALRASRSCYSYADFRQKVALAVYGDDLVCTVDAAELWWFNRNTFMQEAATLGFNVMDALKTGDIKPYDHIDDLTFLKRRFVHHGHWVVGALEIPSILKSMLWMRKANGYMVDDKLMHDGKMVFPTGSVGPEFIETVGSGLTDLAMHGEDVYSKYASIILPQLERMGVSISTSYQQEVDKLQLPL